MRFRRVPRGGRRSSTIVKGPWRSGRRRSLLPLLLGGAVFVGAGLGAVMPDGVVQQARNMGDATVTIADNRTASPHAPSDCVIKGNISINTGKRIYHVPGQKYYQQTKISPEYGERWFCTEAEAQAAGWRRARQ